MSPRKKDMVGGRKRTMSKGCKTWEPSHHKCSETLNRNLASGYSIFPCEQSLSFPSLRFLVSPCQFSSSMRSLLIFQPMPVMNPGAVSSFCMVCFQIPSSETFSVVCRKITARHLEQHSSCVVIKICSLHLNASVLTPGDSDCKIHALFYPLLILIFLFHLSLLLTRQAFFLLRLSAECLKAKRDNKT